MAKQNYEKQNMEWKASWHDEYLKWICGYANAQGGIIEIGKNDKDDIVGLANPKKLMEDLPNKIKNSMGIVADLVYQDEIHGSLVTITDKVMDLLYTKYLKGIIHYEGIQRVDRYPVAQESMREAILNAILHKDNMQYTPVQIKVFPDSVFIFNAGQLPDAWTVKTLFEKHGSKPHNPLVAAAIFRTGMIESWGRGIEKILLGCERIGAPIPMFKSIGSDMSIEFFAPEDAIYRSSADKPPITADKPPITADKPPTNREQAILDFIDRHGGIANRDAREILGLKDTVVKELFRKMVKAGRIEALGGNRNRVYCRREEETV
jgi:ATP-dependent DNA helicase RecG